MIIITINNELTTCFLSEIESKIITCRSSKLAHIDLIEYIDNDIDDIIIKLTKKEPWGRYEQFVDLEKNYHNPIGPSYRSFFNDGTLNEIEYCINGALHCLDGPAHQSFYKDGKLLSEDYNIRGIFYSEHEYWEHPDVVAYKQKMLDG